MSSVPTVGITRNLNIFVLTQLRLELFRIQLLNNCTCWKSTQRIRTCWSTGVAAVMRVACCSLPRCTTGLVLLSIEYNSSTRSQHDYTPRLTDLPDLFSHRAMRPSFACSFANSSHHLHKSVRMLCTVYSIHVACFILCVCVCVCVCVYLLNCT